MITTTFKWKLVAQGRLGVSSDSVVRLVIESPREVVEMSLADWGIIHRGSESAVMHKSLLPNGYRPSGLAPITEGTFPVLVGLGNGRTFLIDGAHRVAAAILCGRATIAAVVLSEAETRSCVRGGQMELFERETSREPA